MDFTNFSEDLSLSINNNYHKVEGYVSVSAEIKN